MNRIRQGCTVIEEISLRKKSAVSTHLSDSRLGGAFSERFGAYEIAGSRPRRLRGSKGVWGAWSPPGFSVPFHLEKEQCLHKSTERRDTGNESGRSLIAPTAEQNSKAGNKIRRTAAGDHRSPLRRNKTTKRETRYERQRRAITDRPYDGIQQ